MKTTQSGPVALTFNTCAAAHLAARLHAASCPMVVNMTGRRGAVTVEYGTIESLAEDVADLNERGFTVKTCKCMK